MQGNFDMVASRGQRNTDDAEHSGYSNERSNVMNLFGYMTTNETWVHHLNAE